MNLNIDFSRSEFARRIDRQLDIPERRVNELFAQMEEIYSKLSVDSKAGINGGSMGHAYKQIAAICNNIEEYTLCMHVFVFRSARSGHLKSEIESN